MQDHTFVFLGGLHRSGTSLLFRCLREHPHFSGFENTGVPEDEGQHLQTVYPPDTIFRVYLLKGLTGKVARVLTSFGGAGKFGFRKLGHLTEASSWATEGNASRLFKQWTPYWDTTKPFLVEKSPSNIIRARFFQRLFPNSAFLILVRHPIAVSLSTQRFRRTPLFLHSLLKHWTICHEIFRSDAPHLRRVIVVAYEKFVLQPQETLDAIYHFLRVPSHTTSLTVDSRINAHYFQEWKQMGNAAWSRLYRSYLTRTYEAPINRLGYSLIDLNFVNADQILVSEG